MICTNFALRILEGQFSFGLTFGPLRWGWGYSKRYSKNRNTRTPSFLCSFHKKKDWF